MWVVEAHVGPGGDRVRVRFGTKLSAQRYASDVLASRVGIKMEVDEGRLVRYFPAHTITEVRVFEEVETVGLGSDGGVDRGVPVSDPGTPEPGTGPAIPASPENRRSRNRTTRKNDGTPSS